MTAVPVGIAFLLGRRQATRRFTYGYGRAEDVAGVVVVLVIAGSAIAAAVASIQRLANPTEMTHLVAVAVAAVIGFVGNEAAAQVRIRTGRKIGSAALVADSLHARTDAITSLAVLASVGGAALGWRWADPIVGLLIAVAISMVTYTAAKQIVARLMDAVDPALVDQARTALVTVPLVDAVDSVRLRWIGHSLRDGAYSSQRCAHPSTGASTTVLRIDPGDVEIIWGCVGALCGAVCNHVWLAALATPIYYAT